MVALLVAMSIMAVMMTVAMPVWKQATQRDKEEELIFRGKQYAHAIELYGRKFANTQPPSIDVLVQQKFLRKKYKDPITGDDFQAVTANLAAAAQGRGAPGASAGATNSPTGSQNPPAATPPPQQSGRGFSPIGTPGSGPVGGIVGVASKSKDKSIRIYNGRSHYNEWVFVYQPQQQTPGAGVSGVGVPGRGTAPPIGTVPGAGGRGRGGIQPGQEGPGGRIMPPSRGGGGFPGAPIFPGSATPPPPTGTPRGRG
jgi:type II secretory pathway pseudopilin PulG